MIRMIRNTDHVRHRFDGDHILTPNMYRQGNGGVQASLMMAGGHGRMIERWRKFKIFFIEYDASDTRFHQIGDWYVSFLYIYFLQRQLCTIQFGAGAAQRPSVAACLDKSLHA